MKLLVLNAVLVLLCFLTDAEECFEDYPRHTLIHKLQPGEQIVLDGILDEKAWTVVSDIGPLSDIEGSANPSKKPYLETSVRLRWDSTNNCIYLGAFMEEPSCWASLRDNNTRVFLDNDFEMFVDASSSGHFYKEIELGTGGAQWNILMVRPYSDGGPAVCNASLTEPDICSKTDPEHGVYSPWDMSKDMKWARHIEGTLNDPNKGSKWWSLEACLPINRLVDYSPNARVNPKNGDIWRINFLRVEWHLHAEKLSNGTSIYVKDKNVPCENWAWEPTRVVNIHLPERFGIMEFSELPPSKTANITKDQLWPIRSALSSVYLSEKAFKSIYVHGYTSNLLSLVQNAFLPSSVANGKCTSIPKIALTDSGGFVAEITSLDGKFIGSVTDDRLFTFKQI